MLSLFKRNLLFNLLLLCAFALALYSYHFLCPPSDALRIVDFFGLNTPAFLSNVYLKMIFSLILILVQAIILNRIVNKHRLSKAPSYLCAACLVLFLCFCLSEEKFHEVLIANLFAIFSVQSLFGIYKKHLPVSALFNAGALMGIAAIFYQPYFIFIVALLLGVFSLRSAAIKEFLQLVVGFFAPYFFSFIALYYFGNLSTAFGYFGSNLGLPFDFSAINLLSSVPIIIVFFLITLIILFKPENCKKKKFDAIKKIEFSYWILFLSIFALLFVGDITRSDFILISIPVAVNLGLILESKSNSIIKEFLFLVFIGIYIADLIVF